MIELFTYDCSDDVEKYVSYHSVMYINKTTGKLISRQFENRDPLSFRPGSISTFDKDVTYDDFKKILLSEDKIDSSKYETLNEENWKLWLENNYLI